MSGEGLKLEVRSVYTIKNELAGKMRDPGNERKVREFNFESGETDGLKKSQEKLR